MTATELRDPDYKVDTSAVHIHPDSQTMLILDSEGKWCDIPAATHTAALLSLVEQYYHPQIEQDEQRLDELSKHVQKRKRKVVTGPGLFYYQPPEAKVFPKETQDSTAMLIQTLSVLGFQRIHTHLFPSLHPFKQDFLQHRSDPNQFYTLASLRSMSFVLCPALCLFEPGALTGECIDIGYNSAIAIQGNVLLELLSKNFAQYSPHDDPETIIFINALKKVVKNLVSRYEIS